MPSQLQKRGRKNERSSTQKVLFDKISGENYGFVSHSNAEIEKAPLEVVWLSSC